MTQVQRPSTPSTTLANALRIARDRSARGNASRRDWQRVAEIDPDLAYRELRDFLRRTGNGVPAPANPYTPRPRVPGALLGFLLGLVLMIGLWVLLPYARENWMGFGIWRDVATGGQFLSTLLVPLGAILGARWSRSRETESTPSHGTLPNDASFDELLDRFEGTQNAGRARVY